MALTPTEEAQTRQLIAQEAPLLSLASNEPTITSKLGATKVNLSQLPAATVPADADIYLVRQGTTDKSVAGSVLKTYFSTTIPDATSTTKGVVTLAVASEYPSTSDVEVTTPAYVSSALRSHGQCYLSLSGANLLLSPQNGNKLIINGLPYSIPSAGVSLTVTGATASTLYYIYAYMNAGVMTLERSATAYAVDANTGVTIKNGDATRTLVGMARTTAANAWADSLTQKFVISWFNRKSKKGLSAFTAGRTAGSGNAYVEINTEFRVEFINWSSDVTNISVVGSAQGPAQSCNVYSKIAVDGVGTDGSVRFSSFSSVQITSNISTSLSDVYTEGYHYATLLGKVDIAFDAAWLGSATPGDRCVNIVTIQG